MKYNQPLLSKPYHFRYEDVSTENSFQGRDINGMLRPCSLYARPLQPKMNKREVMGMIAEVQNNERKLIGQELHDNVNQILTTVKLFMDMLQPDSARDMTIKDKSITYVMMAISEIRKISRELVSNKKEEQLADKIYAVIDDIHFSTSMNVTFSYNPAVENLNRDRKITLFRIIQEQLKNVVSYSKAEQVGINLDIRGGKVIMEIKDNGVGFNATKTSTGIGLSNIYERVTFFKGSVDVKTAEGKGCELLVSLPAA